MIANSGELAHYMMLHIAPIRDLHKIFTSAIVLILALYLIPHRHHYQIQISAHFRAYSDLQRDSLNLIRLRLIRWGL